VLVNTTLSLVPQPSYEPGLPRLTLLGFAPVWLFAYTPTTLPLPLPLLLC
jgi:hypothetical protein